MRSSFRRKPKGSSANGPIAAGGIGLDGFVPGFDKARQEFVFAEQLELALEFDLPALIHIRRARDLVLKHLRRVATGGGSVSEMLTLRDHAGRFAARRRRGKAHGERGCGDLGIAGISIARIAGGIARRRGC